MNPPQEKLFKEIVNFTVGIFEGKPMPTATDLEGVQKHAVFSQAFGAIRVAASYWDLRKLNRNYEAQVLARNLFERQVNVRYAVSDKNKAAILVAAALTGRVRRLGQLIEAAEPEFVQKFESIRDQDQAELDKLLAMANLRPGVSSDLLARAKDVGLMPIYRSIYFSLSEFTHPPIKSDVMGTMNNAPIPAVDMLTFMAPLETAIQWAELRDPSSAASAKEAFLMLYDQVEIDLFN